MSKSLFTFFAVQQARIRNKLWPVDHNPPHSQGPRRPDLQEQEATPLTKILDARD